MTPERWQQVREMLAGALERAPADRVAYLDQVCAEPSLRREVESLLAREKGAEGFLEAPALEVAAKMLGNGPGQSLIGRQIGSYQVLSLLGAGGMGEVYRARDPRLERDVALKVLPAGVLTDEAARRRFRKEALTLAKLNHPHIATVFEFDTQDGVDFLVMEYIAGRTLAEKIGGNALSEREVASLGGEITAALEEAHEHGVVHRDLKPGNVMVTEKGQVKVLDFGLAKLLRPASDATITESFTETQAIVGTLPYMAPEQLRGESADARTDIHALGAVLYEMATSRRPFQDDSVPRLTDAILHQLPVTPRTLNPRVSPDLERVILKCLEKDPENRYQSAKEVSVDLRRLALPAAMASVARPAPAHIPWRKVGIVAGIGVATVIVAGILSNVAGVRERLMRLAGPPRIESIAVLPFENLSHDPDQEYFADGMTDALTTDLAQISALRVISRTSTMRYKGTHKSLPEIARDLNVEAVVEGSASRSGNVIHVNAQLIFAPGDRRLWGHSYDVSAVNLRNLQAEIAGEVAREIGAVTPLGAVAYPSMAHSVNPEAYDLYLRAESYYGVETQEATDKAMRLLEKSRDIDPEFAAAYAALATTYLDRGFNVEPLKTDEWVEKSMVAVQKALSLDQNLAEAYASRGYILWSRANNWAYERAVGDFRHAISLNPNLAEAHHQLANVYNHVGLLDKAQSEIQRAAELDPLNSGIRFRVGINLLYQGKYEDSLAAIRDSQKFNPPLWVFQTSFALQHLRKLDEAQKRVEAILAEKPNDPGGSLTAMQALLAADVGDARKAEVKIQEALEKGKGFQHFHHVAYAVASSYALMNRPELALRYLQITADDGFPCYPLFEHDPNLDHLRNNPHFLSFIAEQKTQWEYLRTHL